MSAKNVLMAAAGAGGAPSDPNFKQTVLLLHGDGNQGANNLYNPGPPRYLAFTDNSPNNFPITVNGDAYGTNINPYQQNYSWYFNGTSSSYVDSPDSEDWNFGGVDFTIEFWINVEAFASPDNNVAVVGQWSSSNRAWVVYVQSSTIVFSYSTDGSNFTNLTASTTINRDTWYSIAITRSNGTIFFYVNGNRIGTPSIGSAVIANSIRVLHIGATQNGSYAPLKGYISNLRILKGLALNTGTSYTVSTTPLTAIGTTVLLTCKSNRFYDENTQVAAKTLTPIGTVRVSQIQPFTLTANNYGSGYFDGTGDYLVTPATGQFTSSGDFIISFWAYLNTLPASSSLMGNWFSGTSDEWLVQVFSDGSMRLLTAENSSYTTPGVFRASVWQYIAVIRSGASLRLYVNGTQVQSYTKTGIFGSATKRVHIGINQALSQPINGYLSDIRFADTAVAFGETPPTEPSSRTQTNLNLLTCQYSGSVRNVGFIDSSPNYFPITRNPLTGPNAPTQGTFSPFSLAAGEWSNYFDGNTSSTLTSSSTAHRLDAVAFTIEMWLYSSPTQSTYGILGRSSSTFPYPGYILEVSNNLIRFQTNDSTNGSSSLGDITATTCPLNQWFHLAIVREGTGVNQAKMYINGALVATNSMPQNLNDSNTLIMGSVVSSSTRFTGYISNLRIVKGRAVYTAAFTPSTTPLGATSGGTNPPQGTETALLTCQSNRFVDNSTNGLIITRNGNMRVTPFSPFAPTAAYSAGTNGGSGYFDGTGDYLTVANNSAFDFAGGNFTIEGWFYRQADVTQRIIAKRATGTGFGPFLIAIVGGGQVSCSFSFNGTTTGLTLNSSVNANLSEWNHFAVTRSGSSWTLWLNGASVATNTNASSLVANTDAVSIGVGSADGTSGIYTGYLADIRFVKGTAVYTSAFTPPTAPVTNISNTSLLLNFTNAGILDQTGKNVLETVGNAQIDTAVKKYGTGSMKFDGTGDYLLLQNSPELAFGTGAFTIEFWYYSNDTGVANLIYDGRPAGLNGAYVTISKSAGNVITFYTNTANQITGTTSLAANTWYHIAVARSGTSTKLFINGTQEGSTYTDSNNYINGTSRPIIGAGGNILGNLPLNGYIDDLRITKGVARYTQNFPVPSAPFLDK